MKNTKIKIYRQDIHNLLQYLERCAMIDVSIFSPPVHGLIKYHCTELTQKLLSKYNEMNGLRWNETREIAVKFPQLCILAFLFNKMPAPPELMNVERILICGTGENIGERYPILQDLKTLIDG